MYITIEYTLFLAEHTLQLCLEPGTNILNISSMAYQLRLAVRRGSIKCVERLANENHALVEMTNEYGETPLFYASYYGHFQTVQYLVKQQQATIDSADAWNDTPLLASCYWSGSTHIIRYLIQNKADFNHLDF